MMLFLFLAFLASLVLTLVVRNWAIKRAILDLPNERSSHSVPIPRGGGIAIAIIWFIVIFFLFFHKDIDTTLFLALLCGLPISVVGLVDDVLTITPKIRLLIQVTSAILALFFMGGLGIVDIGFTVLSVPYLFSIIAIVGLVWFTNLFNFLDGIDGYISTEIIFISVASFILFGAKPPLILAAAIAGFLVWNWQPAKIFMGDVGSTLLGFTIGIFAIYYQNIGSSSIIVWLMLTSLFWFDATFTLYRRWRNNEILSNAHRKHAYQRIVQYGFSHQKTVIFSIVINLFILGLVWLAILIPTYSILFFCINMIFLYFIMMLVDNRFPFSKI